MGKGIRSRVTPINGSIFVLTRFFGEVSLFQYIPIL